MKNTQLIMKTFPIILLFTISTTLQVFSQADAKSNFFTIKKNAEKLFNDGKTGDIQKVKSSNKIGREFDGDYEKFKRWEWYWQDRVLTDGSFPDLEKQGEIYSKNKQQLGENTVANSYIWKCINQEACLGGYNGMGRTTAIAFHPTDVNTFYVGAPIGGIWKTIDGGKSYKALGDSLPYVSTGCIALDYINPDIIYISLSDRGGWWNYSLGVYKSIDAGLTWKKTGLTFEFTDGTPIYALEMSPTNPNILYAATGRGIYRTINAGASWSLIKTGTCYDLKIEPGSSKGLYASFNDASGIRQVFRSDNNGSVWTQKTNFTLRNNSILISVTPADPNMVAILNTENKEVHVSKDRGDHFSLKSVGEETSILYISPYHPDTIYHGYMKVWQSKNGGDSWNAITNWYNSKDVQEIHADQHFVSYNPLNKLLYFCNDGGLYSFDEERNIWNELSNGLIITQFYKIAVAQTDPIIIIGGTQDNGGLKRNADGSWSPTNGGDGMEVAIDPRNHNIFYTTYCNGVLYRTTDGWRTSTTISDNIPGKPKGNWVTPYVLDPSNSNTIIAGYSKVFRSINRGTTWTAISTDLAGSETNYLQCIAVANSDNKIIYTSHERSLFVTKDLGVTWTTYSAPFSTDRITSIAIHPTKPDSIWITKSGYGARLKVYESANAGKTWKNISGSLPNVPVSVIACDTSKTNNSLYVGTDAGVYYKDDSTPWTYFGKGLPNTAVTDIKFQYNSKKVRIGTYGRGAWETTMYGYEPNAYPAVNITSPTTNSHFSDGESISISANATDSDSEITKVVFYNKATKVAEITKAPYTLSLLSIDAGEYSLIAKAIDSHGNVSTSDAVNFVVDCPSTGRIIGKIIGTSGSYNNGGNTKEKVFDGDINTYFDAPTSANNFVGIDAGEATDIVGLRFIARSDWANRMTGGYFEVSNSSTFAVDVEKIYSIQTQPGPDWICLNIALNKKYRFIRYVSPAGGYGNIAELEVYSGISSTGINPISNKRFSIYPNPFVDSFMIESISDESTLTLSSTDGRIIPCNIEKKSNGLLITPIGKCSSGTYMLSIQEGNKVFLLKTIKK